MARSPQAAASCRCPAGAQSPQGPVAVPLYREGKIKLVDALDIATGRAQYGMDTRLDGMLYAVVARPPVYGGKVESFDAADALKVPGVIKVVTIDASPPPPGFKPLGGVAVIGEEHLGGDPGARGAQGRLGRRPQRELRLRRLQGDLEDAARKPGKVVRNDGDFAAATRAPPSASRRSTTCPHLAHASMEPPAASARIVGGKCEAWGCVQSPQAARDRLAKRLGMPADDVTVHVTLLGGGFGRKSKPDYVVEAALLSKAMDGKPVKVVWTREDDLHHDYFHTVSVEHLEAGSTRRASLSPGCIGRVAPTIMSTFVPKAVAGGEL